MAIDDFHLPRGVRRHIPRSVKDMPRALIFIWKHRHLRVPGLSPNILVRLSQQVLALIGFNRRYAVFLPDLPIYRNAIRKTLFLHACRAFQDKTKQPPAFIMRWQDTTIADNCIKLNHFASDNRVLNIGCRDISKSIVEQAASSILGYSTKIDPLVYRGKAVEKSDSENGRHDGKVVICPLPPDQVNSECIYMILINNETDDQMVEDLRVPIIDGAIPFVYRKVRPLADRFSNTNSKVTVARTDDLFSDEEVRQIVACAKAMGLDYAEADILRNRDDGRIYFIDTNWCAYGFPNHITLKDERIAAEGYVRSFSHFFVKK